MIGMFVVGIFVGLFVGVGLGIAIAGEDDDGSFNDGEDW